MVVYNPLAGGLLTGKYNGMNDDALNATGRYSSSYAGTAETPSPEYRVRYFHGSTFKALELIRKTCTDANIPMVEASLRWLMHHSYLNGKYGDGIIIAGSNCDHIKANLASCSGAPLPKSVLEDFDQAWKLAKSNCPGYFRGYDPVNGESYTFLERF